MIEGRGHFCLSGSHRLGRRGEVEAAGALRLRTHDDGWPRDAGRGASAGWPRQDGGALDLHFWPRLCADEKGQRATD